MKNRTYGLDENEVELVKFLMAECKSIGDIQEKVKRIFVGTMMFIFNNFYIKYLIPVSELDTEKPARISTWASYLYSLR